jgi:hypothetical protein
MALTVSGAILVRGGNDARVDATSNSGAGTAVIGANGLIQSGGAMTFVNAGSLDILGGIQAVGRAARATGTGTSTATTQTNASIISGGDFAYTGGSLNLAGGTAQSSISAGGINTAIAQANASLMAAGNKTINITGNLTLSGGSALDGAAGNPGGAWATAMIDPGTLGLTTSGNVALTGGTVTGVGDAQVLINSSGAMTVAIGGTTGLTVTGSAGSGVLPGATSPLNLSFSGGGTQNLVTNAALDTAGVATQATLVPPPSVALPGTGVPPVVPPVIIPPTPPVIPGSPGSPGSPPAAIPPTEEPPIDSATTTDLTSQLITASNESSDTNSQLALLSGESTPGDDDNRDRRRVAVCR